MIYDLSDPNEIIAWQAGDVALDEEDGLTIAGMPVAMFKPGEGIVGVLSRSLCCGAEITDLGFCAECGEHAA